MPTAPPGKHPPRPPAVLCPIHSCLSQQLASRALRSKLTCLIVVGLRPSTFSSPFHCKGPLLFPNTPKDCPDPLLSKALQTPGCSLLRPLRLKRIFPLEYSAADLSSTNAIS